jgi:heme/copper-type cytochrome/quinol oxidase subunit 2
MPADAPVTTVSIQGENCEWIPDRITVNKGSHVVLNVNSVDWNYNFRLKNYELLFYIPQGETVSAEFYAAEPGEFEFGCYIEEGRNYYWGGMVGKLIVE